MYQSDFQAIFTSRTISVSPPRRGSMSVYASMPTGSGSLSARTPLAPVMRRLLNRAVLRATKAAPAWLRESKSSCTGVPAALLMRTPLSR